MTFLGFTAVLEVFPPLYWVSQKGKIAKIAPTKRIQRDFNGIQSCLFCRGLNVLESFFLCALRAPTVTQRRINNPSMVREIRSDIACNRSEVTGTSVPDSVEIWGNYCANGIEAYEGLQSGKKNREFLGDAKLPISNSGSGQYSRAGQNEAERRRVWDVPGRDSCDMGCGAEWGPHLVARARFKTQVMTSQIAHVHLMVVSYPYDRAYNVSIELSPEYFGDFTRGKSTAISPVADNMADNNPAQPASSMWARNTWEEEEEECITAEVPIRWGCSRVVPVKFGVEKTRCNI
ncbi:hypothetical protein FB451DRAFT_1162219 [Mycena latifolia]|nr:hypothetical protein FB451DRAFT_1162219 [Mycena latifolia]